MCDGPHLSRINNTEAPPLHRRAGLHLGPRAQVAMAHRTKVRWALPRACAVPQPSCCPNQAAPHTHSLRSPACHTPPPAPASMHRSIGPHRCRGCRVPPRARRRLWRAAACCVGGPTQPGHHAAAHHGHAFSKRGARACACARVCGRACVVRGCGCAGVGARVGVRVWEGACGCTHVDKCGSQTPT